jgi:hypothetical protein
MSLLPDSGERYYAVTSLEHEVISAPAIDSFRMGFSPEGRKTKVCALDSEKPPGAG